MCWPIIKGDTLAAFSCFHRLNDGPLPKMNGAHITILPKKEHPDCPSDFRPISLIHSFAKLISKVLARRLSKHINNLVSGAQSAFIKRRCIQDNFLYVRNLARTYHRKQRPALLLKLDIIKAFDSVSWEYLIEMLDKRGFPPRWRNWITLLLSTSTSVVQLNGVPGP